MDYSSLSEREKIPFRIQMAEIRALEAIRNGVDLNPILKQLIEDESFCGAEGIRRALEI